MARLHALTAIIEAGAELALIAFPAVVVRLLLGGEIYGAAIPLGRVAGVALFRLGIAFWLARDDGPSRPARGLVVAMEIYNLGGRDHSRSGWPPTAAGRHRLAAGGDSSRGDGRLVPHGPFENGSAKRGQGDAELISPSVS